MSRRIRTIKPELLEDAVTAGLSDCAFRLFIAIILMADDHGRLRGDPRFIQSQVFWARTCERSDLMLALDELAKLVQFYDVDDQRYAEVRNWAKHQKISHPSGSRLPPPPESSGILRRPSEEIRKAPEEIRTDLGSGILDRGPRTMDHGPSASADPPEAPGVGPWSPFAMGTGSEAAKSAYVEAVSAATKSTFGFPRGGKPAQDLCELLNEHGPKTTRPEALVWLAVMLAEWIANANPLYAAGWAPAKLNEWLNANRPKARPASGVRTARGAEITKQPFDPDAPWMHK